MYLSLDLENIDSEHICCAFSDKKCAATYQRKKQWLKQAFGCGYTFKRLDERAKVFIEYGPAENAWLPVTAPGYLNIGCFWVSGKYKKQGHGKALLQDAIRFARSHDMNGLVTVTGTKKNHFMSDAKWLLRQGFEIVESRPSGFSLLSLSFKKTKPPFFNESAVIGKPFISDGVVAYYSDRCPYAGYHAEHSLVQSCKARNIPLTLVKITSVEEAQAAPSPATIFSLFYNGTFLTTDISCCLDSRFDKLKINI